MSVLGPAPKRIDPEERRMIDQAVAAGKVKKIPMGVRSTGIGSVFEYKYHEGTGKLQAVDVQGKPLTNKEAMRVISGKAGHGPMKSTYDRRAKVKRMIAKGMTQKAIAKELGVHYKTIAQDVKILKGKAHEPV